MPPTESISIKRLILGSSIFINDNNLDVPIKVDC